MCVHMPNPRVWLLVTLQLQSAPCHCAGADPELTQPHVGNLGRGSCLLLSALAANAVLRVAESATPAVWTVFMLFQMSSEVQPALHSFLWDLLILLVGPQASTMHPQRNKHCVPNLKDVSIWAPSSQKKNLGSKARIFLWACCQDHLFEVVSAPIQSYTICCLFTVCYK